MHTHTHWPRPASIETYKNLKREHALYRARTCPLRWIWPGSGSRGSLIIALSCENRTRSQNITALSATLEKSPSVSRRGAALQQTLEGDQS